MSLLFTSNKIQYTALSVSIIKFEEVDVSG